MICSVEIELKQLHPEPKTKIKLSARKEVAGELTPRENRRERRRERSREEIVVAARRVLLRDGIAATTVDAVAQEVGLTKAALYYYYPSKKALLFEVIYGSLETQAEAVQGAVAGARNGAEALSAIIRETVHFYGSRLDDFRLSYLHGQVAAAGSVRLEADQLARIRPLNEIAYGNATKLLFDDWIKHPGRAKVAPRLMTFLAQMAALGLLTVKGMTESLGDSPLYSDEQLSDALASVFEAAARP
jgi:AcrR family transcriptional regulator